MCPYVNKTTHRAMLLGGLFFLRKSSLSNTLVCERVITCQHTAQRFIMLRQDFTSLG